MCFCTILKVSGKKKKKTLLGDKTQQYHFSIAHKFSILRAGVPTFDCASLNLGIEWPQDMCSATAAPLGPQSLSTSVKRQ